MLLCAPCSYFGKEVAAKRKEESKGAGKDALARRLLLPVCQHSLERASEVGRFKSGALTSPRIYTAVRLTLTQHLLPSSPQDGDLDSYFKD